MIEETVHSHRNDISKKRKEVQSSRPDSCPECGDRKICKDGLRKLSNGETTQRWLCKNCAHRFSDTKSLIREAKIPLKDRSKQTLINTSNVTIERQVGKFLTLDLDNLAAVKPLKEGLAGATKQTADIKGKIVEFLWHLKKNGYSSSTITLYNTWLLTLTRLGVDLKNPEGVKEIIALHDRWSTSTKSNVVAAYKSFADFLGLRWTPPKYNAQRKLPFVPLEKEIDVLIAGAGKKTAAVLLLLKETGMRIGEATKIQWTDIDTERSTITVNNPEKNSNARIFKVSHKLISILYKLPRKGKTVFNTNSNGLRSTFQKTRRRLSFKLQNPRLMQIHFHTFRHWKATMEYHKTRDPYHVKQLLGHKKLQNTEIYINIEHAIFSNENDDFHSATAKNVEDARQLIEVGFEFVCTYNDTMLFRKRK